MPDHLNFTNINAIAGMIPWACSYKGLNGGRFAITLYASSPKQLLEDNCDALPELQIDGQLVATTEQKSNKNRGKFDGS